MQFGKSLIRTQLSACQFNTKKNLQTEINFTCRNKKKKIYKVDNPIVNYNIKLLLNSNINII